MGIKQFAFVITVGGLLLACQAEEAIEAETSSTNEALIYGSDDRREIYETNDPALLSLADSTAAMIDPGDLYDLGGGMVGINTSTTFGSAYRLCSWEPYRDQPSSASCTGFLVGEDLLVTAGHCASPTECPSRAFLFGFEMLDANTVRDQVPVEDLYFCAEVLAYAETSTNDYSLMRLDRAVVGHQPLSVRRAGAVANDTPLVVIGHPAGIPMKIADNASVRSNSHSQYFEANLDTYGGNSGSPVFNAETHEVEGILVRGNTDFSYYRKKRCYESNQCDDSGCPGFEDATRITQISHLIPNEPNCQADIDCDNGDPCDGLESCVNSICQAGVAPSCADVDACSVGSCVATGAQSYQCEQSAISCSDGDPCTVDLCDPVTGCGSTPLQCGADEICVDGACVVEPSCTPARVACSAHAECCSGRCHPKKGTCQ